MYTFIKGIINKEPSYAAHRIKWNYHLRNALIGSCEVDELFAAEFHTRD